MISWSCTCCGWIDSNIAYYFYVETDRGFELKSISSDDNKIYLVETDEKSPSITTKKDSDSFGTYKVIYVTVGTIIKSFTGWLYRRIKKNLNYK